MFKKNKSFYYSVVFLFSSLAFLVLSTSIAKAVFYGTPTTTYPQSGYILIRLADGNTGLCGANIVSENVAITAAHCLAPAEEVLLGIGEFDANYLTKAYKAIEFNYAPEYNVNDYQRFPGLADVGVVLFNDDIEISEYAFISSPKVSCNYYLVGYGGNQSGGNLERTGTDVCIKNITDFSFELDFDGNSHFCVGDSGSGIYEKGTNNIVGVVSAYYNALDSDHCADALAYVAARVDYNLDYLTNHIPLSAYQEVVQSTQAPFATQVPQATEVPAEVLPDDYFGEYYPETKKDDGTFNYNDEILIEIQKLDQLFEDIYPDDEIIGATITPTEILRQDELDDLPIEIDDQELFVSDPPKNQDGLITSMLCGLCCCMILVFAGVGVTIYVVKKKKQPQVNQTNEPVKKTDQVS